MANQKKRKATDDDEVEIPTKKHKNIETDIPYAESSKNAAKRKANEDINKEQPKKPSKYLPFTYSDIFLEITLKIFIF